MFACPNCMYQWHFFDLLNTKMSSTLTLIGTDNQYGSMYEFSLYNGNMCKIPLPIGRHDIKFMANNIYMDAILRLYVTNQDMNPYYTHKYMNFEKNITIETQSNTELIIDSYRQKGCITGFIYIRSTIPGELKRSKAHHRPH